jgi:hypothetical protein
VEELTQAGLAPTSVQTGNGAGLTSSIIGWMNEGRRRRVLAAATEAEYRWMRIN